jgi:hypothetical protein
LRLADVVNLFHHLEIFLNRLQTHLFPPLVESFGLDARSGLESSIDFFALSAIDLRPSASDEDAVGEVGNIDRHNFARRSGFHLLQALLLKIGVGIGVLD